MTKKKRRDADPRAGVLIFHASPLVWYARTMEDKEAAKVLEDMLAKYEMTEIEKAALRQAIGVLAWTKLIEGYTENRKKKRDRERQLD